MALCCLAHRYPLASSTEQPDRQESTCTQLRSSGSLSICGRRVSPTLTQGNHVTFTISFNPENNPVRWLLFPQFHTQGNWDVVAQLVNYKTQTSYPGVSDSPVFALHRWAMPPSREAGKSRGVGNGQPHLHDEQGFLPFPRTAQTEICFKH